MMYATPTHAAEPITPIAPSAPGPLQKTVCTIRKPMPAQAKPGRRRTAVIVMSVPTAATYQVAYPLPPGRCGSSVAVTSSGSDTATASEKAASQIGIRVPPVGASAAAVTIAYSTIAAITGAGSEEYPNCNE